MVAFVPPSGNDPPFLATWPMDYSTLAFVLRLSWNSRNSPMWDDRASKFRPSCLEPFAFSPPRLSYFFSLSNCFTSGNKVDDRLMASQVVQGTRFHMGEGGRELFDVWVRCFFFSLGRLPKIWSVSYVALLQMNSIPLPAPLLSSNRTSPHP